MQDNIHRLMRYLLTDRRAFSVLLAACQYNIKIRQAGWNYRTFELVLRGSFSGRPYLNGDPYFAKYSSRTCDHKGIRI
jgi:hypothetical protein